MNRTVEVILREAMQLSNGEREQLIDELLTTLETGKDENVDAAWAREVEKRAAELSQGTVAPVVWDEVKRMARERAHGSN